MKKLLLLMIVPMLALSFNSCSKDDKGDVSPGINKITFNGQTYNFIEGLMCYWGPSENLVNTVLLFSEYSGLDIDMYVSNGNNKLMAGTYTFNDNAQPFTFYWGQVFDDGDNDYTYNFTGGTIKVDVSGNIYTITIDVTLVGGGTAKGIYKGALQWYDKED